MSAASRFPLSQRLELAREADAETTFLIPIDVLGPAWLRVSAWDPDGTIDDECIKFVEIFRDHACAVPLSDDVHWQNLADTDALFAEIRKQQNARDAKRSRLLKPVQETVVAEISGGAT